MKTIWIAAVAVIAVGIGWPFDARVAGAQPADGAENRAPIAGDDRVTVAPGESVRIELLANDHDPDGRIADGSLMIRQQPLSGAIEIRSDGSVTYTPEEGFTGADGFVYQIRDNRGAASNEAAVVVTVADRPAGNLAPLAAATATSSYSSYPPGNANDADPRTYWLSNYVANYASVRYRLEWERPRRLHYLEIDWAGNYFPSQYEVLFRDGSGLWKSLGRFGYEKAADLNITTGAIRLDMTNDRARYNTGYLGMWEVVVE